MTNVLTGATSRPSASPLSGERTLLIVEDDKSFLQRLARAMEGRGFVVATAESVADGLLQVERAAPAFAVVDMRLGDGNGLDVISAMKKRRPEARAIILTGYGNIATAVNAVKLGGGHHETSAFHGAGQPLQERFVVFNNQKRALGGKRRGSGGIGHDNPTPSKRARPVNDYTNRFFIASSKPAPGAIRRAHRTNHGFSKSSDQSSHWGPAD